MNLENKIVTFLRKNNYKPNYLWAATNYLNGFLINIPNYRSATMQEFQIIMKKYCELGYFTMEQGFSELPNYRLTVDGYQVLVQK